VAAAAVVYVLVAVARPTHPCPRCHGDRIQFTRHWLTGKARTRPCRRCSGTGRVPRFGARTIHRLIWSVRQEKNKP
jgi:DnaJ-class molecular chaperone